MGMDNNASLYRTPAEDAHIGQFWDLKPGEWVRLRDDLGNEADYEVMLAPWQLGHGEWVVRVRGITGGYALSRVVARVSPERCAVCRHRHPPVNRSVCFVCVPGETPARSQVQAVGGPAPKTWDDYERGCLATYGGGYQSDELRAAFHHGISTVFNLLRAEFPNPGR